MFILLKSRTSLQIGHVGSKTRSLGQILGKPCVRSRDQIFGSILMKLGQGFCHDEILYIFANGSCQVLKSLGKIIDPMLVTGGRFKSLLFNSIPHNPEGSGERLQGYYFLSSIKLPTPHAVLLFFLRYLPLYLILKSPLSYITIFV